MSDKNNDPNRPERESIWTIAAGWAKVYFAVFSTLNIMNAARVIWFEATQASHAGWSPLIDAALDGIGRGVPGNVGLAIAIIDIGRVTMVLGGLLEQWINERRERQIRKAVEEAVTVAVTEAVEEATAEGKAAGIAEGEAAGIARGRTEINDMWRAWNARRMDAVANGEPFDEPPPDVSGASENGR